MTVLEDRYRRVLRVLPVDYRGQWEEEMVATFLDSMTTGDPDVDEDLLDLGRPGAAECLSVVGLGVRLRLGGAGATARAVSWGEAVRAATLLGLLCNALLLPMSMVQDAWISLGLPLPAAGIDALSQSAQSPAWRSSVGLLGWAWVLSYLAVLLGRRHAAVALALLALVPSAVAPLTATAAQISGGLATDGPLLTAWCLLVIDVCVVAGLAAFHREAPRVPRAPWLRAFALGTVAFGLVGIGSLCQPGARVLFDLPGLLCLVWIGAARFGRGRGSPAGELTLSILSIPVLLLRASSVLDQRGSGLDRVSISLGVVEVVAVAAMAVVQMQRTRRLLPPESHASPNERLGGSCNS
jgi:hypothetical protein